MQGESKDDPSPQADQEPRKLGATVRAAAVGVGERLASWLPESTPEDPPIGFARVYQDELKTLNVVPEDEAGRAAAGNEAHPDDVKQAWNTGLFGLAFSGGGIRSATFNLGVIQALSELKLLRRVHYLSVVSGGGYIGGWLTALLHRRYRDTKDQGRDALFAELQRDLSASGDREDPAIVHLRNFSNYLTPRKGLMTADTWSAVATYLRNVLLNQTILVASLLFLFIVVWWLAGGVALLAGYSEDGWIWAFLVSLLAGIVGGCFAGYNLASIVDDSPDDPNGWGDKGVFFSVTLPAVVGAIAACVWLPYLANADPLVAPAVFSDWLVDLPRWLIFMVLAGVFNLFVWAGAFFVASRTPWHDHRLLTIWLHTLWTGVVAAFVLGALLWWAGTALPGKGNLVQFTLIPPLILGWWFLVGALHTGLLGTALGTYHREWLSRVGAWMLISALAWLFFAGLALFGPFTIEWTGNVARASLLSGWLATTLGAVLASRQKEGDKPGLGRRLLFIVAPYVFILGLMALVSLGARFVVFPPESPGLPTKQESLQTITGTIDMDTLAKPIALNMDLARHDAVGDGISVQWRAYLEKTDEPLLGVLGDRWHVILGIMAGLVFGVILLSWRANINEFSLRNMYANRLVRCYLGASSSSKKIRHGQPFTGFSAHDELRMGMPEKQNDGMEGEQRLAAGGKETTTAAKADPAGAPPPLTQAYGGPYLLVNTAVNLAKCSQLAWQERRAASFLLSPGYCGFETPMGVAENRESGCYRPTARFASSPKPLTLGDAMATSGAAANPTMGFRSKTAYSVLLALFNVRLGRWVGNPTCDNTRAGSKPGSSLWPRIRGTVKWEEAWVQSSPRFSLWYLIKEAFNSTSDQDRFLQLSDGGHFDNLGLYALVKRRCRYIVCCDAGADGNFEYEDLGNAIRKCRIDLGVEIDIDVSSLHPGGDGHCEVPCAVGRIRYPSEKRAQSRVGTLIYIKPCKAVDMPSDVVNYALTHAVFPHETTADQFFSESQFESYRELGCHLARRALKLEGEENIARLFPRLQRRWYSRRNFESATFTRHAATLDQLFDRLRKDPQLALLDRQFYPSWREVFSDPPARREEAFWVPVTQPEVFRSCFYFCNSLIQLMENVFLDLDLQERQQYEHPDNRGWLNLFRHWSWSGMLRVTWALSAPTYGVRFQEFCKHTLGLGLGKPGWDTLGETEWNATRDYHAEGRRSQSEITGQITGEAAAVHLNFVEWQQICAILGEQYDSRIAVFRMSLELDVGGINRPNVKLPVAYAVVEDNKLLMYRVQDHVRKMGLGRQGLLLLLKVTNDPPQSAVLALGEENRMCRDLLASGEMMSEDAASKAVSHFSEMFDSVCHEWQRFPNA